MQKRKLILLCSCALLLLVCIAQAITKNKNNVKLYTVKEELDSVCLEANGTSVWLVKNGDKWLAGRAENDAKYETTQSAIDSLLGAVKSVKVLDKVGNASSEASQIRYDLTDAKKITVTAFAGGKEVRKITVGKSSATGSQGYIMLDNGSDVFLASGNLSNTFGKTLDDLRSRSVWTLDKNMIGGVTIRKADGTEWKLSRTGQSENIEWKLDGHGIVTGEVDSQKAENWFAEFANLSASSWYDDSASPDGKYLLTCEVEAGGKTVALDLFQTKEGNDDEAAEYCASSTESPYTFALASYSANKFLKNPDELLK